MHIHYVSVLDAFADGEGRKGGVGGAGAVSNSNTKHATPRKTHMQQSMVKHNTTQVLFIYGTVFNHKQRPHRHQLSWLLSKHRRFVD